MADAIPFARSGDEPGDMNAPGNAPEFSVSELAGAVKRTIEGAYDRVRVRGELGRVVVARSGHIYADLKDDRAVIAGVMWKGAAAKLPFKPEEGLEVVCEGKLTTYPGRSQYQLVIDRMAPAGVGALMALLEERKKKLAAEGLFDADRKQALPFLPEVIGVVTSPTGAVIRDILHRITDRFPRHVLIWPSLVQGEAAAAQIAAGITGFNALEPGGPVPRPDVIIVARGGGSIEDLWAFNEEVVVRTAAASRIPLISAVGHETDTTLIDYASDRRAPTPTGAAEMAVPVRTDLAVQVRTLEGRLATGLVRTQERAEARLVAAARGLPRAEDLLGPPTQRLDALGERVRAGALARLDQAAIAHHRVAGRLRPEALGRDVAEKRRRLADGFGRLKTQLARGAKTRRERLGEAGARLRARDPSAQIARARETLTGPSTRLVAAGTRLMTRKHERLEALAGRLEAVNPKAVLARGYALVRTPDGGVIKRAAQVHAGMAMQVEFADGARSGVFEGEAVPASAQPAAAKKPRKVAKPANPSDDTDQGALF